MLIPEIDDIKDDLREAIIRRHPKIRNFSDGSMLDITVELPKLLDRRDRAVAVFKDRGITDLFGQVQECVDLLADLTIRAEFINRYTD